MLASLKFVEKYISLPKIKTQTVLNNKQTEIETYNLEKITSLLTRQGFEVDSIRIHGENLESVVVGYLFKTRAVRLPH
jgi:tmRNA-binding protein